MQFNELPTWAQLPWSSEDERQAAYASENYRRFQAFRDAVAAKETIQIASEPPVQREKFQRFTATGGEILTDTERLTREAQRIASENAENTDGTRVESLRGAMRVRTSSAPTQAEEDGGRGTGFSLYIGKRDPKVSQ